MSFFARDGDWARSAKHIQHARALSEWLYDELYFNHCEIGDGSAYHKRSFETRLVISDDENNEAQILLRPVPNGRHYFTLLTPTSNGMWRVGHSRNLKSFNRDKNLSEAVSLRIEIIKDKLVSQELLKKRIKSWYGL